MKIDFTGVDVSTAIFEKAKLDNETDSWNNPISALWDQDVYHEGDRPSVALENAGLSEYVSANYLSDNTAFSGYAYPSPDETNYNEDIWLNPEKVDAEDGKVDNRIYFKKVTGTPIEHFAAASYYYYQLYIWNKPELIHAFILDDKCYEDYAAQLIPRAVGYSAALLDYFFRGNIEITAPDSFLYAIIDGSGPHEFSQIKLKVRNTTPDEEMQAGSLIAVARYKKRKDYREDLSTDPPQEISRETAFSYSVSAKIDIDGLSSTNPHPYTFDFSEHPIPAGITDLTLQVVFKGTLGNEKDIAVAVGMKDLYEPMHITTWNSTDYVYINDFSATGEYYGVLATGQQIRDISSLFNAADIDGDGVLNEVSEGEAYIDPHIMTRKLGFSPVGGSTGEYQAVFEDLPPGRYGRVLVLMDAPLFNLKINSISVVPELDEDPSFEISAIVNQENEKFQADQVYLFRGIQQHIWSARAWTIGSNAGIDFANWPPVENADPYPASEIKP